MARHEGTTWWEKRGSTTGIMQLVAALGLVASLGATSAEAADLGARSAAAVKKAISDGSPSVTLLVASKSGKNASVVRAVGTLGGVVRFREDDLDYLRVVIAPEREVSSKAANAFVATGHSAGAVPR